MMRSLTEHFFDGYSLMGLLVFRSTLMPCRKRQCNPFSIWFAACTRSVTVCGLGYGVICWHKPKPQQPRLIHSLHVSPPCVFRARSHRPVPWQRRTKAEVTVSTSPVVRLDYEVLCHTYMYTFRTFFLNVYQEDILNILITSHVF